MEASNVEHRSFGITFETSWMPIHDRDPRGEEPDNYVTDIVGRITCEDDQLYVTEGRQGILAGTVLGTLVRVGDALEDDYSVYEVFDSRRDLFEAYEQLFVPHRHRLRSSVEKIVETKSIDGNILFIDYVELLPAFRGARIGQGAILSMIRVFGRRAVLLIADPFPPQCGEMEKYEPEKFARLRLGKFTQDKNAANRRLRRYMADLEFRRLPKSNLMIRRGWDSFEPLPTLRELRGAT